MKSFIAILLASVCVLSFSNVALADVNSNIVSLNSNQVASNISGPEMGAGKALAVSWPW